MKKTRLTILAILAVILLATTSITFAQGWGRGGPGYGLGMGPGMGLWPSPYWAGIFPGTWAAMLNLTPEQIQKMQTLREAYWKEIAPLQNELVSKRLELRSLWLQPNPEQDKILAKQKEINALIEKLQEKATKHRLEMRQILTPEQQAKLSPLGSGLAPWWGRKGWFGPGRGMGYGPCFW